jgi:hypothetical protein
LVENLIVEVYGDKWTGTGVSAIIDESRFKKNLRPGHIRFQYRSGSQAVYLKGGHCHEIPERRESAAAAIGTGRCR